MMMTKLFASIALACLAATRAETTSLRQAVVQEMDVEATFDPDLPPGWNYKISCGDLTAHCSHGWWPVIIHFIPKHGGPPQVIRRCQKGCDLDLTVAQIGGSRCPPNVEPNPKLAIPAYRVGQTCVPCRGVKATPTDMSYLEQCHIHNPSWYKMLHWTSAWDQAENTMFEKAWPEVNH